MVILISFYEFSLNGYYKSEVLVHKVLDIDYCQMKKVRWYGPVELLYTGVTCSQILESRWMSLAQL